MTLNKSVGHMHDSLQAKPGQAKIVRPHLSNARYLKQPSHAKKPSFFDCYSSFAF